MIVQKAFADLFPTPPKTSEIFLLAARFADQGYAFPLSAALVHLQANGLIWQTAQKFMSMFFGGLPKLKARTGDMPMVFLMVAAIAESEGD